MNTPKTIFDACTFNKGLMKTKTILLDPMTADGKEMDEKEDVDAEPKRNSSLILEDFVHYTDDGRQTVRAYPQSASTNLRNSTDLEIVRRSIYELDQGDLKKHFRPGFVHSK